MFCLAAADVDERIAKCDLTCDARTVVHIA